MVEQMFVKHQAVGSSPASSAIICKARIRQRGKRKSVKCFANQPRRVDRVVMCQPAKLGLPFIRYSRSIRLPSAWCLGRDGFHCAGLKSQRSWFDSTEHRKAANRTNTQHPCETLSWPFAPADSHIHERGAMAAWWSPKPRV